MLSCEFTDVPPVDATATDEDAVSCENRSCSSNNSAEAPLGTVNAGESVCKKQGTRKLINDVWLCGCCGRRALRRPFMTSLVRAVLRIWLLLMLL